MKKGLLFCILLLSIWGHPFSVHAQRIGVSAGVNFDRLSDITYSNVQARFESQTGWHIGVWLEAPLGPFGLQLGVRYLDAGQLFEGISSIASVRDNFDINLVEIPVLLSYSVGTPVLAPYIFGGPVLRIATGVEAILKNNLRTPMLAAEVGGGVELSLGKLSLYPEVAYSFGVTSFVDDELLLELEALLPDGTQSLNSALLRLRVGF